ncbi:MAG: NAD(P)-dependent oxidoreductase [Candidatus Parcubacteria bacterium]|nr:NAD(P)-dependent oxidoreductase [Candidatus Parcubacteria bacterium]
MSQTVLFGGSGFLGPIILEKYPDIISIGRSPLPPPLKNKHISLSSLDDLTVLDSVDFDKVIFLVGSSNHHIINTKPSMGIEYNVLPLKKILFYLQKRKIKKFICFTTILLYDVNKMKLPVGETQAINPYINDYVFSKYLSEELIKFYSDKIPSIAVRFSNIYGPTRLVRPDLVPTLIQKALSPNEVSVWNIKPVRDFLYTPDAADAIVRLLETDYTGPVNLGTGKSVSVGQIAEIIEKLSGKKIKNLDKPVSGPMNFVCDISLVKKLTGWEPKYSIEQGLKKTYETMKQYANECLWWEKNIL